jgi:hypothetical protein
VRAISSLHTSSEGEMGGGSSPCSARVLVFGAPLSSASLYSLLAANAAKVAERVGAGVDLASMTGVCGSGRSRGRGSTDR